MSDALVKRLREVAQEARDDFAQRWFDAEITGERPDLHPIVIEMGVEEVEEAADRIEALTVERDAALARAEKMQTLVRERVAEAINNLWPYRADQGIRDAIRPLRELESER